MVLFPNSQKNSHLYKTLESTLANHSDCQLLPVARKYYDETEGQKQISELMVDWMLLCLRDRVPQAPSPWKTIWRRNTSRSQPLCDFKIDFDVVLRVEVSSIHKGHSPSREQRSR